MTILKSLKLLLIKSEILRGLARYGLAVLTVASVFVVVSTNAVAANVTTLDSEIASSLNTGGNAVVNSVSCSSASSCVAGGYYLDSSNKSQSFVSVYNGTTWTDSEIAGSLNTGGFATVNSVSCSSASSCVAGGSYVDSSNEIQALVSVYNGTTWTDSEIAGSLNTGGVAVVNSVSCFSASSCVAGGYYKVSLNRFQAFVSVYNGSTWTDSEIASSLNTGGDAGVSSVTCFSVSSCVAGSYYRDSSNKYHSFVSVYNGTTWTDSEIASSLNTGGFAVVNSVSCSSASSCVAGGYYYDSSHKSQSFVSVLSSATSTTTAPPIIYSKPTAPSNVTASMNNGTATVSFTPGNSGNLPTYNQIDMLINGQSVGNVCNVTGATSCPITNLGPDVAFSFTVTAINSKGSATSAVSNVVSYASPTTVAPTTTTTTTTTTTMPPAKQTITCVKGKITKKVTAVKPVCPAGYVKK